MKQLLIVSGKGGTGKTTVASAFIRLLKAKFYADCDVDAPNLHLTLRPAVRAQRSEFYGLPKAHIQTDLCSNCGLCKELCRFDAIRTHEGYFVDSFFCEGCGLCELACPQKAITLKPSPIGELLLYERSTVFSTAMLKAGSGNSGKLVSGVKKQLTEKMQQQDIAVLDGSPGIGCPVIASLSGVDAVLIVTEPSVSGLSDLKRIVELSEGLFVKTAVCINKYDINTEISNNIEKYCTKNNITFAGKIPFDKSLSEVGKLDLIHSEGKGVSALKEVYKNTIKLV